MKKKNWIIILGIIFLLNLVLLITNKAVLIYEKRIKFAEFLKKDGSIKTTILNLPEEMQSHRCKYWTGRSVLSKEFYVNKVPQCPFITSF